MSLGHGPLGALPLASLPLADTVSVDLSGVIGPVGDLTPATTALLFSVVSGQITPAGALRKGIAKAFTGEATPAGDLAALALVAVLAFLGAITPAGGLSRIPSKMLSGALSPLGTLIRRKLRRPIKMLESIGFTFRG